jgi:transcriptional regulator with XRE-family HTH domain
MSAQERLASFRRCYGLSREDIAEKLAVYPSMIGHLERGDRSPGLDLAVRIEALTASWPLGPIRCHEWVAEPKARDRAA